MRSVLLCFLLVGWSSPIFGQHQKMFTNSIGMKLVLIHAGSFTMGAPIEEVGRRDNESSHEVTISKSYYLGAYEVTLGQYEKVMGGNPSKFKGGQLPVETVSWDDAVSFCQKLSAIQDEKAAGREYRLPTEAEWEYACRATSTTSFCFGDSSESHEEYAWFGEGLGSETHPMGEKAANRWGLYDMHGMSGSGVRTGMVSIQQVRRPILRVRMRDRAACPVVVVGWSLPRIAGRRAAFFYSRRATATTLAFALP